MDHQIKEYLREPLDDLVIHSVIPDVCRKKPVMMGIDEAGRGPVLGPMVYSVAYFPVDTSDQMKKQEFADSKTLTEEKREEIFRKINESELKSKIGWFTKILSPNTISNASFKRSKYNLNALSHDTAIALVKRALDQGITIESLYVDTVGPKDKYQQKLQAIFPEIKVTVENKADSKFHVVSAASICAKVTRDRIIKEWRFIEKDLSYDRYGSGYPGDPNTKKFLKESFDRIFGYPSFVRFCWSTVKTVLDSDGVPVEFDGENDANDTPDEEFKDGDDDGLTGHDKNGKKSVKEKTPSSIRNFFKRKSTDDDQSSTEGKSKKQKLQEEVPHAFFLDRNLERVTSF